MAQTPTPDVTIAQVIAFHEERAELHNQAAAALPEGSIARRFRVRACSLRHRAANQYHGIHHAGAQNDRGSVRYYIHFAREWSRKAAEFEREAGIVVDAKTQVDREQELRLLRQISSAAHWGTVGTL